MRTPATLAKWFRTQRVPSDPKWTLGCTVYSTLMALAVWSAGRVGPAISGPTFRSKQRDDQGGIDLYDAKVAARAYGVNLTVFAHYGPSRLDYPNMDPDEPAGTLTTLRSLLVGGRVAVVQGKASQVPDSLDCGKLEVDHAVCVAAYDAGENEWLVGNPVCYVWKWWPDKVLRAFTAALAGVGRADFAVTPLPLNKRIKVRAGVFRRYIPQADGTWTHQTKITRGFDVKAGREQWILYGGNRHHLVQVADQASGFNGWWVDDSASGVTLYTST